MDAKEEADVTIRLCESLYSYTEAKKWLHSPQARLGNKKPVECPVDDVLQILDQIESGAFI